MRNPLAAFIAFAMLVGSAPSIAAPCRSAKGKFAKCGLPGTHPA